VAPVVAISLEAVGVEPLPLASDSLLPEDQHPGESRHQFIERVSARVGADRVRVGQPVADHRPHRMQQWCAANVAMAKPAARLQRQMAYAPQASHPPWLLREPLALAVHRNGCPMYQGPLILLAGPERIESGWWDQDPAVADDAAPTDLTVRDYFVAQSEHAGVLWIFLVRESEQASIKAQARWFLHGIYG
jgi:protein ImuB